MTSVFEVTELTQENLDAATADGYVSIRSDGAGLHILNYTNKAQYSNDSWDNPAVRVCRGLIVDDDDWNVVARPWSKFFNYGDPHCGELDLDTPVEVTDKADGSLGVIHRSLDGHLRVATRGSFASDQAIHATTKIGEYGNLNVDEITPLAEIVYPDNRIVLNYGDTDTLYLLGGVEKMTGRYLGPAETREAVGWQGPETATFGFATLREALLATPRPNAEGLCVRFLNEPKIIKLKQEDYVALHRIVTGLSERTVWENMVNGNPVETLLEGLPDELHVWTRDVARKISEATEEWVRRVDFRHQQIMSQVGVDSRKDYAVRALQTPELASYLFKKLDAGDYRGAILKHLKPSGATKAKPVSEDTA